MPFFSIPLSGLNASSTAMATIANNLANLNTVGYKGSTTQFADLFYETLGSNGAGDPIQVGAGTGVSANSIDLSSGNPETTGVATDVAIMGNGFFVVQQNGTNYFTRAGNFQVGTNGALQTANGEQVMGYSAVNGVIPPGAPLAPLQLNLGQVNSPQPTTSVQLNTNLNASANVGDAPFTTPVTVYDSLGDAHVLDFNFTKTAAGAWSCNITIPNSDLTPPPAWAASTAYTVGQTISPPSANGHIYRCTVAGNSGATPPSTWPTDGSTVTDGGVTWQDMGTQTSIDTVALTFDSNGRLTSPTANVAGITASGLADGASDLNFTWKLYDSSNNPLVTQLASNGPSATSATLADGYGSGSLTGYTIGSDGVITGSFSNGQTAPLGQIALANFANAQGLERVGQNDFSTSLASGAASIGAPGTGGLGTVEGSALETSNVDIATEFSALIVAQRDYEANARTVTTFDQVMQDTINMKTA